MAFDGIVTKAIAHELNKIIGYKIDKIYEPTKSNIVLGLYGNSTKLALNICIDSSLYRMNLTTHPKPNPTVAPNFCMLLRKYLIGARISKIETYDLERIITFELETIDDFENQSTKKLIIELMGKHSNIILADNNNIIIDSLRHTNTTNNSYRDIFPHAKYIAPKTDKMSFLELNNFEEFYSIICNDLENNKLENVISNKFTGISTSYIKYLTEKIGITKNSKEDISKLYNKLKEVINAIELDNLSFELIQDGKEYALIVEQPKTTYELNFFIDDFYYEKETNASFISYRNSILKLILDLLKKYNKRLLNINDKLEECKEMDKYRIYGELLTANLYKINNKHLKSVEVINYYEGNNIVNIPLNNKYTTNENAKRYFKKYNKLKKASQVVAKQKQETIMELDYIESIVYELESATTIEEVNEIYDEISENIIFKERLKKSASKNKKTKKKKENKTGFNPLQYEIEGYKIYVGRNNKENDWLTTKFAEKQDIWFHTKDIHGSHVILKTNKEQTQDEERLVKCAELAAKHSKAKQASNVPVDFCKVQYVKKPNGAKPGMVIYTNNKTLYVTPK